MTESTTHHDGPLLSQIPQEEQLRMSFLMPHGRSPKKRSTTNLNRLGKGNIKFNMLWKRSAFSNTALIDACPIIPNYKSSPVLKLALLLGVKTLRGIWHIKNLYNLTDFTALLYIIVCWGLTQICIEYKFKLLINPVLTVSLVIFPLAFTVNSSYQRRETAGMDLSTLKSSTATLFLELQTWGRDPNYPADFIPHSATLLRGFFATVGRYLMAVDEEAKEVNLRAVYNVLQQIFEHCDILKQKGLPGPLIARLYTELRQMADSFERLRYVADYRTPSSIRSFNNFSLLWLCCLMPPYYAGLALEHPFYGHICPVLITILYMWLRNVTRMLENPFVAYGVSDQDMLNLHYLRSVPSHLGPQHKSSDLDILVHEDILDVPVLPNNPSQLPV